MSNQLGKPHDPSTSFGLTLKNIKHAEFASQETHCFEATIYLHGKPAIKVENDGRGGADNHYGRKGQSAEDFRESRDAVGKAAMKCNPAIPRYVGQRLGNPTIGRFGPVQNRLTDIVARCKQFGTEHQIGLAHQPLKRPIQPGQPRRHIPQVARRLQNRQPKTHPHTMISRG